MQFNKENRQLVSLSIFNATLLILTYLFVNYAKQHAQIIERIYTRNIYPKITSVLAATSRTVPFSLAEIVAGLFIISMIVCVIRFFIQLYKRRYKRAGYVFLQIITHATVAVFLFMALWGLNNYRLKAQTVFGLGEKDEITIDVLSNLYLDMVTEANQLRENLSFEDYSNQYIYQNAYKGYQNLKNDYGFIPAQKVRVKPITVSPLFSSSGYTGIYAFYSSEPHVNTMIPIYSSPFVAMHELAHQNGFAGEDEANFMGFLACIAHDDPLFQYSGYYNAIAYVGSAIYRNDKDRYFEVAAYKSELLIKDAREATAFWDSVIVEKNSEVYNKINDAFLKVTNQPDGVLNYSKVVELLALAYIEDLF